MKYLVINAYLGDEATRWVKRTVAVYSVEPLTEPTDQERLVAEREHLLDEATGGGRRRLRRRSPVGEPSIEAWDAGCRTIIYGPGGGEGYLTAVPFEVLNNYLDATNLTEYAPHG